MLFFYLALTCFWLGALQAQSTEKAHTAHALLGGKTYVAEYINYRGGPFLSDHNHATVWYLGALCNDVRLRYDVYKQKLVYIHQLGQDLSYLELESEFIDSFMIGKRKFVHHRQNNALPRGFYEVLLERSGMQLMALRQKVLNKTSARKLGDYAFHHRDRFFLKKDDIVQELMSRNDLVKALRNIPNIDDFISESVSVSDFEALVLDVLNKVLQE